MNYKQVSVPWEVSDSIPDKLSQSGAQALSNNELLSVILDIPVETARQLTDLAKNDLKQLAILSTSTTEIRIPGIGIGKLNKLKAVFELSKRRRDAPIVGKYKIRCSQDLWKLLQDDLSDLQHEEFWIILLDRANNYIDQIRISQGGVAGTVTDVRIILNFAITKLASGIILAHNHPSGNLSPSEADLAITRKIKSACSTMDINLLDHLILSDQGYLSMADDNLMP